MLLPVAAVNVTNCDAFVESEDTMLLEAFNANDAVVAVPDNDPVNDVAKTFPFTCIDPEFGLRIPTPKLPDRIDTLPEPEISILVVIAVPPD